MASSSSVDDSVNIKHTKSLTFYPSDNWGLDFYFQTYNKMYICDILSIEEYAIFPGAYMYKNHPIYKVDIIGVVVRVDQNSKCFMYEVDDGTGVISCSCWKMSYTDQYRVNVESNIYELPAVLQNKFEMMNKTDESRNNGYSLGNVINIRGKISTFRNKRQIVAANHKIVEDPMVQVFRMMELPKLYKMKYDKPFELPWKVAKELSMDRNTDHQHIKSTNIREIKSKLCNYFQSAKIDEISTSVVSKLDILQPFLEIMEDLDSKSKYVLEVLTSLEDDGYLCRRIDNCNVFEVLFCDCDLDKAILQILREDCGKENHMTKGCHCLHVLKMLHRTFQYSHVKKQCVIYCLEKLEEKSEIIRSTNCHYIIF